MAPLDASAIIDHMEREAYAFLRREREFNSVIERRCPGLREAPAYQRGPLPPSDPRFNSWSQYVTYLGKFEMGRFNPNVKAEP